MTKPVTALCDQCKYITDVVFHKAKHQNGIEETYFKCEHCHYRYTSFVTDAWVRKKQRALKAMPRNSDVNVKYLDESQIDINKKMTKLKYNLINFGRADL